MPPEYRCHPEVAVELITVRQPGVKDVELVIENTGGSFFAPRVWGEEKKKKKKKKNLIFIWQALHTLPTKGADVPRYIQT